MTRVFLIHGFWSLMMFFVSIETIKTFETFPRRHYFTHPLVRDRAPLQCPSRGHSPSHLWQEHAYCNYPFIFFGNPRPLPYLLSTVDTISLHRRGVTNVVYASY
jgi:hypothetical protein